MLARRASRLPAKFPYCSSSAKSLPITNASANRCAQPRGSSGSGFNPLAGMPEYEQTNAIQDIAIGHPDPDAPARLATSQAGRQFG
jgi:hypothetical protein